MPTTLLPCCPTALLPTSYFVVYLLLYFLRPICYIPLNLFRTSDHTAYLLPYYLLPYYVPPTLRPTCYRSPCLLSPYLLNCY